MIIIVYIGIQYINSSDTVSCEMGAYLSVFNLKIKVIKLAIEIWH